MKRLTGALLALVIVMSTITAEAQKGKKGKQAETESAAATVKLATWMDTISYIVGYDLGNRLKEFSKDLNLETLNLAIREGFADSTSRFTPQETDSIMSIFQNIKTTEMNAANETVCQENKAYAATFLATNKNEEGVVELPSGLQFRIIEPGSEVHPIATSNVTVHYKGMLLDGTVFDSSFDRNEPVTFQLDGVIPGWTEGLQQIGTGGKIILYIPPHLAYGDRGGGPIPPGSLLIFEVELISVQN